jgi:hypothetical protein
MHVWFNLPPLSERARKLIRLISKGREAYDVQDSVTQDTIPKTQSVILKTQSVILKARSAIIFVRSTKTSNCPSEALSRFIDPRVESGEITRYASS